MGLDAYISTVKYFFNDSYSSADHKRKYRQILKWAVGDAKEKVSSYVSIKANVAYFRNNWQLNNWIIASRKLDSTGTLNDILISEQDLKEFLKICDDKEDGRKINAVLKNKSLKGHTLFYSADW